MDSKRRQGLQGPVTGTKRRSVLAVIFGGAAALFASALGLAGGFLSNALRQKSSRSWARLGRAEDLDTDSFQKHVVRVEQKHAWIQQRRPLTVYIRDLYPDDPLALTAVCSHLGCSVSWDATKRRFLCPCHGGVYDENGQVLEGPPPRPLTRLDVKIQDEVCFVRQPASTMGEAIG